MALTRCTRVWVDQHQLRLGRGDQVGDRDAGLVTFLGVHDDGAARVAEAVLDVDGFFGHDIQAALFAGQDVLEILDTGGQFLALILEFLAFQGGQAAQRHIQDGLGLDVRQGELLDQVGLGGLDGLRVANDINHLVDHRESLEQAFQDVHAGFGFGQLELGAAGDDHQAVGDELAQQVGQGQVGGALPCPRHP